MILVYWSCEILYNLVKVINKDVYSLRLQDFFQTEENLHLQKDLEGIHIKGDNN